MCLLLTLLVASSKERDKQILWDFGGLWSLEGICVLRTDDCILSSGEWYCDKLVDWVLRRLSPS